MPLKPGALHDLGPRILNLEGDPDAARTLDAMLRPWASQIVRAGTLAEAIDLIRGESFDAAFVDLNVPDSQGLATLEAFLRERPDLPAIVVTGEHENELALGALRAGAADFLEKGSFNAGTIARSLRHSLARNSMQRRFRALVENAEGIALIGTDGRIKYASPSTSRLLGRDASKYVGTDIFEHVHPDDVERSREAFERCIGGETITIHDVRYRHRDGTWRRLDVTRANCTNDPAIGGIVVNYHDVTASAEAREALARLRDRYETILNSIVSGVIGCGCDGRITFANPSALEMLGWEAGDLIGRPAHETVHRPSEGGEAFVERDFPLRETLSDGEVRHTKDDLLWRKDGTPIFVCYTLAPMREQDGSTSGAVLVFQDMTHRRELEAQVEQAHRVVSLGRVAATVAHEFNNVLMSMRPFVDIVRHHAPQNPAVDKALAYIVNSIKRGQHITSEILRFTNPAEPALEPIDVAAWLRGVCDEAQSIVKQRTLITRLDDENVIVRGDSMQLHQVLTNLLVNAREATHDLDAITVGTVRDQGSVVVNGRPIDNFGFAGFFVRDCGKGIPGEMLDRIFEPLFTTNRKGGTGLGLTVSQQILTRHGGKIVVDSAPDQGSTFYVLLPVVSEHPYNTEER